MKRVTNTALLLTVFSFLDRASAVTDASDIPGESGLRGRLSFPPSAFGIPARSSVCDPQTTANVFWPLSPLHKFISFDLPAIFLARRVLQLLSSRGAVVDLNQGCRNCVYPHHSILGGMSFFLSSAFQYLSLIHRAIVLHSSRPFSGAMNVANDPLVQVSDTSRRT